MHRLLRTLLCEAQNWCARREFCDRSTKLRPDQIQPLECWSNRLVKESKGHRLELTYEKIRLFKESKGHRLELTYENKDKKVFNTILIMSIAKHKTAKLGKRALAQKKGRSLVVIQHRVVYNNPECCLSHLTYYITF
ncbi:hypothetical protein O6H91_12G090000 [Diphasiastrum complanatum]|uniref:Uncharacterized protein n=1 Tax=Diphasiastrum complanatum TaxID=34168 RepID=A0ACC2C500_DIPCM|nr:hypothetical protein O6H91_12G090000 [Diphasiastrum complanatum]